MPTTCTSHCSMHELFLPHIHSSSVVFTALCICLTPSVSYIHVHTYIHTYIHTCTLYVYMKKGKAKIIYTQCPGWDSNPRLTAF